MNNKKVIFSSLFLTAIALMTSASLAAETAKPHQKADFLKTVDSNKDGKASKAEFIAAMERKFNSMDVDKSEAVSVQELKVYGEKDQEARKKALQAARELGNFGKITSKSRFVKLFTDRAEREFAALDKNHDNVLSADEVGAQKPKKKKNSKAKSVAKPMSKAEFIALFTESANRHFTSLDKNRDGKLTETELGIKPKVKAQSKAAPSQHSKQIPPPHKPQTPHKKVQQQKLIKSFFVGIDADKDGQISSKEKNAMFENLFKRLDSNHDQRITQEEIIAGRHKPLSVKQ